MKIATSKSPSWRYEREWRLIIDHKVADKLISLPAPISGIIFGRNMVINHRKTIARILGADLKYAEAKKKRNEFALKIIPVGFDDIMNAFVIG